MNSRSSSYKRSHSAMSCAAGRTAGQMWIRAATVALSFLSSVVVSASFQAPAAALREFGRRPWRRPQPLRSSVVAADHYFFDAATREGHFDGLTEMHIQRITNGETSSGKKQVQFKGIASKATRLKAASAKELNRQSPTISRSSTMPGFAVETNNLKAYRRGLRMAEQRTGTKIKETKEARSQRRKANGQAMYQSSAAVPESMVQFANEIHREERISREEEIELGEKTQDAIRLQNLYDNLEVKLQRQPTDEEWCAAAGKINMEAISQTIEEGLEAKNRLVTSNLRMVQSVVNTYIRNGLTAQYNAADMMQEGIMALIRAAEKFEPERGFKFSTYAMYWVRASVKRSQIYQSRPIPVPQRLYENHKRLLRVENDLQQALGRRPTRKEMGEVIGMSELQVNRCFKAMQQRCFSLDQAVSNPLKPMNGDVAKNTLIEIVDGRTDDGAHEHQRMVLLRGDLIETLHRYLSPIEVELLLLRFGLKETPTRKIGRQVTIAEVSSIVGMKPDKVRRMITKSLQQLKAKGEDEWLAFERELM